MNRTINCTLRTLLLFSAVSVSTTFAQSLDIDWHTIDGGGAMWTAGGELELSGTIGQPDTDGSLTMTGTTLSLTGGFWAGTTEDEFCPGDLDGDNDIDLSDLAQLLGHYGTPSGAAYEDGDLDLDGDVDLSDLAALLGVYGTTCP
jgi:hypothetical protein